MNAKEWIDAAVIRGERVPAALVIVGGQGSGKDVATRAISVINPMRRVIGTSMRNHSNVGMSKVVNQLVAGSDIAVFRDVVRFEELDALRNVIPASHIDLERLGADSITVPAKANMIIHAEFWPHLPLDNGSRFVVTTPLEVIAIMLEHLAR